MLTMLPETNKSNSTNITSAVTITPQKLVEQYDEVSLKERIAQMVFKKCAASNFICLYYR
jgi:hypothetical protein